MSKTVLEDLLRKIALKQLECLLTILDMHFMMDRGEGISKQKIRELKFDMEELNKLKEELP